MVWVFAICNIAVGLWAAVALADLTPISSKLVLPLAVALLGVTIGVAIVDSPTLILLQRVLGFANGAALVGLSASGLLARSKPAEA